MSLLTDDRQQHDVAAAGRRAGRAAYPAPPTPTMRRSRAPETTDGYRRPPGRRPPVVAPRPAAATACTRRARVSRRAWLLGLAFALAAGALLFTWLADCMATASVPTQTTTVSVAPGETLWDVATRLAPDSAPGAVVDRIEELNGVRSSSIVPGLALTVPRDPGAGVAAG